MSSNTDDLRDIIAAQVKTIQISHPTLMEAKEVHEPTMVSRPEPEFKLLIHQSSGLPMMF
jgi:hypothetical protein